MRNRIFYLVVLGALLLVPGLALASTSVGNNVTIGGTLGVTGVTTLTGNTFVTGTLQSTGAVTAYGNVTLGDTVGDSITITGKLGTIYVADGTTTSTHTKNSLAIGEVANFNVGKFYVDSSGNINSSGTLAVVGATTLTGALTAAGNVFVTGTLQSTGAVTAYGNVTLGDAASDSVTLNSYFNTMTIGDLTTTSTLTKNSLAVGAVVADKLGKFYVDSSGNVSASGTLGVVSTATFTGAIVANGAVTLGDTPADSITVNGKLGTISVSSGTVTSSLTNNSFYVGAVQTDLLGKFAVDSSGNVTTSGTITAAGAVSLSSNLAVTGAIQANGAVTLGDTAGDAITVTGKLGTINISDGTTTSSLANNTLAVGAVAADKLGKFYVDSSGNVTASGTVRAVGTSGSTSTLWIGGLEGIKGQICFGDSDGSGATCVSFSNGANVASAFSTTTY